MRELLLGLDIGGTSVKIGAFTTGGELLGTHRVATPTLVDEAGYATVCDGVDELLGKLDCTHKEVRALGLAVPCPVPADGNVVVVANASLNLLGLRDALVVHLDGAVVEFVNDANAAALGELWRGSAQGCDSLVFITLGTGVGGGVVIDGRVASGTNGAAGEIGHICVDPSETRRCGCGRCGCLEQYASARGLALEYERACERLGCTPVELDGPCDTVSLFAAWEQGDKAAREAVSQMCDRLGFALATVAGVIDPARFVLGGGVSGALPLFVDELEERYRHYVLPCSADTPIKAAQLGNDAGMYGAAYLGLVATQG